MLQFLMTDLICHFLLSSSFPVLVAFTTTEHASTQKSSVIYTQKKKKKKSIMKNA